MKQMRLNKSSLWAQFEYKKMPLFLRMSLQIFEIQLFGKN